MRRFVTNDLKAEVSAADNLFVTSRSRHSRLGAAMFNKRRIQPKPTADVRYGDELLSANWNPVIELLARSCAATRDHASRATETKGEVDTEGFLNRVYTLGA